MRPFISVFGPAAIHYELSTPGISARSIFTGNVSLQHTINPESIAAFISTQKTELKKPTPELLIMGRSNVGKSSLINSLVDLKVAKTSKTPGRTQNLFFFNLNYHFLLVDAPGYGFAKAPSKVSNKWQEMTQYYLANSSRLKLTVCLVNAEHGIKSRDQVTFDYLERGQRPFLVVMTKADKVKNLSEAIQTVYNATKWYKMRMNAVHAVSVKEGKGITELRAALAYYAKK